MSTHPTRAVHVWTADPQDFGDGQWLELAAWLDAAELLRSLRFGSQADRQAYILAHALRRLAVSRALAVPPATLVFASEASGKPVLVNAPGAPEIHFSHSRCRSLVACAVTCIGPVGIDVEAVDASHADMGLLSRFMVLPDGHNGRSGLASAPARLFFFYWTVLEAYWKARGRGLSFANPAITCQENRTGWFDLSLPAGDAWLACGQAMVLDSPADCAVALALDASCLKTGPGNVAVIRYQPAFFHAGGRHLEPQAEQGRQEAEFFLNA